MFALLKYNRASAIYLVGLRGRAGTMNQENALVSLNVLG